MDKICGIYYIKNLINGKYYIGQSYDIEQRWRREKMYLRSDKTAWNAHLQNAWKKYGEDNFEFAVIEECTIENLDEREAYWIQFFDSFHNGYNKTIGGSGMRGFVPWNKGKTMPDEYRKTLSESHKGYKHTEEQKENLRIRFLGENNHQYGKFGFASSRGSAVYCITLDRFFGSAADASRVLSQEGIARPDAHGILNCCKKIPKYKTAGKLDDGTRLTWRYATPEEINLFNHNAIKQ
jgi:group I intron endonuclease|nr:MAG TPA: intron associated endonuclease [Caudoviricetes sp.]